MWNGGQGHRLGVTEQLLDRCFKFCGEQDRPIELTTHFDKQVCSSSLNIICWAIGHLCTLFLVWHLVHEVVAVIWQLIVTLVVVSEVVLAGVTTVVGSDVSVATSGSEYHHFLGVCSWVVAWGAVLVAIVNVVVNNDMSHGGCANINGSDVAVSAGVVNGAEGVGIAGMGGLSV